MTTADVVVVGSGAGALVTAARAADAGAAVVVLEKSGLLGGGSALSTGILFLPDHPKPRQVPDSRERVLSYLRQMNQGIADEADLVDFLDTGRELVDWLESRTDLRLKVVEHLPDFHSEWEGGTAGGRHLTPVPYEGKRLGDWANRVRRSQSLPLAYYEVDEWGGPANVRNWDFQLIGTRMANDIRAQGAALVAPLVETCLRLGVEFRLHTRVAHLITDGDRVVGVVAESENGQEEFRASKGVILGSGGFEWNGRMNQLFLHSALSGPVTVPTNEGDGHIMGMEAGAAVGMMQHSVWVPVLQIPGEEYEGKPMFRNIASEKARPGTIMVNRHGSRFINESINYHDMGVTFNEWDAAKYVFANLPMHMVFDQTYKDTYPVATAMPGEHVPTWIAQGDTARALAETIGVDADGLEATIARYNQFCETGRDEDFARGDTAFDRYYGDSRVTPNPSLKPLATPPFYAIKVEVGTFGNRGGLLTDRNGQVQHVSGRPIPGLYACGNTRAQVTLGVGYEGGGTLAQATVIGFNAARAALGER